MSENPAETLSEKIRARVYRLSDPELVGELARLEVLMLPPSTPLEANARPTPWEQNFIAGIQRVYIQYEGLTWRQRKVAKQTLLKYLHRIERAKSLASFRLGVASSSEV